MPRPLPRKVDLRGTRDWSGLAAIISSFTALAALVFTALSLQATREQIAIDAQGEVTARFTDAVSQLGSSSPDVRVGAIFALGSIAHDSAYEQPAIVELLSDFIRVHTGGSGAPDSGRACDSRLPTAADVAAALTVLGRRDPSLDGQATIDLTGACLDNAHLSGMDFRHANFDGAYLEDSFLDGADLTAANLTDADLRYADLLGIRLAGASLDFANLDSACIERADLDNVVLDQTSFAGADLGGASLLPYQKVAAFLEHSWPGRQVQMATNLCSL